MEKTIKKSIGLIIAFIMTLTIIVGNPNIYAASSDENNNQTLDKNKKVASELDKNLETKVRLSFPGKQEVLPSDIVFVLDKSGASAQADIYN